MATRARAATAASGVRSTVSPGRWPPGATTTTGVRVPAAVAATDSSNASGSASVVGTSTTSTASTSSDSSSSPSVARNDCGVISAPRSTGLRAETVGATARSASWSPGDSSATPSPSATSQVCGEHAHAAGVGDDAGAVARGQRLLHQHHRGLGELGGAAARDHAGLREHGFHADVPAAFRRADRTADHDEQRLALGEAAGGTGELQRVAERLQVQPRHRHLGVLAPRGQQVVARHVELGPERDERVHADPELPRQVEQREPHPARLGRDRQPAALGQRSRERRVQRRAGGAAPVAEHALGVRPHDAHAVGAGELQQLASHLLPRAGEPRRHDDGRADPRRAGVGHHVGHLFGRDGDHDQIDGVGDGGDRGVRRCTGHSLPSSSACGCTTHSRPA